MFIKKVSNRKENCEGVLEMKIIIVEAGKRPRVSTIDGELKSMQSIVGGWIEPIEIGDGVCAVCNEEGKLDGLALNRALISDRGELWDIIAGTFFIIGDDYETGEFISLTDEQIAHYMNRFRSPEMFIKVDGRIEVIKMM